MQLIISFSARAGGNSDQIAKYIAKDGDKIVYFRDMQAHSCSNCNYECFDGTCKYRDDGIYDLYAKMLNYQKVILVVPMYCGNPASLYFVFNERCQDFFMQKGDTYDSLISRLFIIGIYGEMETSPDFIPCLEKWFYRSRYSNRVLGIERHKYGLKLKDAVLKVEEIKNKILEFVNS